MKIRNGFVSNSSSSSFMLRGFRIPIKDICKTLDIEIKKKDTEEQTKSDAINVEIGNKFKTKNLEVWPFGNFYSTVEGNYKDVVVGVQFKERFEDGDVIEVENLKNIDEKVRKELAKIGYDDRELHTFIHFLSNDNY